LEPNNKIIEIREPNAAKFPKDMKEIMRGDILPKQEVDSNGFIKL